jgi:PfaB family protein
MKSAISPGFLAVVGMDAVWGGCDGIDAFERLMYEGTAAGSQSTAADPAALLEKVTRRALQDAGIDPEIPGDLRIALISAGCSADMRWGWSSSTTSLNTHANPLADAMILAADLLGQDMDVVVFVAHNSASAVLGELRDAGAPGFGFDRAAHGWKTGSGAGAVVWMRADRAAQEQRRVYALLRSLAVREGRQVSGEILPPVLDDVRACCQEALQIAGITPAQVGYIEAFACGSDAIDGIEIAGLAQSYRLAPQNLTTAIGSAQAATGYLGPAAGLVGLVRAVLCLYQREIPGTLDWSGPKLPALWRNSPFYVPLESRPWFAPKQAVGRFAALSLLGSSGACAHLILEEPTGQIYRPNRVLAGGGFVLFPVTGDSLAELEEKLNRLKTALASTEDLIGLAAEWYNHADTNQATAYAVAIVGHSAEEASRETELALKALSGAFERAGEWQTPLGSYFTAAPAGKLGDVALVYPGAFNSYPGVGKDLLRLFPELHLRADTLTSDLGRIFHEHMLYPRSLNPFTREELAAKEAALLADPIAMLITGTALSVLYTYILEETFGVCPSAAFGYSLGENSMVYATGVWFSQGDEAAARLEGSDAFRQRLAGPQQAIREFWGMPAEAPQAEGPLWSNYLVMVTPEKVRAVLAKEPRVYMTHINTPRQVVIGGDPQACQRVVSELHCSSLQAPFDYALHCEVMRSEYAELATLHSYPVENQTHLRLYSAAGYAPLGLEQNEIAEKMAEMLTSPLDFPHLVHQVYADGARVFIEAGAGSNCARWIDETLKGSPHLALSMNRRGTDDYHTLVRMVARLFSHRVPLRLTALYPGNPEKVNS